MISNWVGNSQHNHAFGGRDKGHEEPVGRPPCPNARLLMKRKKVSNLVDVNLLLVGRLAIFVELDVVLEALMAVGVGLVDLGVLGQLAVGLETAGLIGAVFENHVALLILVIAEREQDDIALVDPHLLAQLAANVRQSLLAVKALRLQAAVAQHLDHLGILLALLLEDELALLVVVFVLAATAVLSTLLLCKVRGQLLHGGEWMNSGLDLPFPCSSAC